MSRFVTFGEIVLRLKTPGHERFSTGANQRATKVVYDDNSAM
jgi:hypothetical protein